MNLHNTTLLLGEYRSLWGKHEQVACTSTTEDDHTFVRHYWVQVRTEVRHQPSFAVWRAMYSWVEAWELFHYIL